MSLESEVLEFARSQWGEESLERVLLKVNAEAGEAADELIKHLEGRSTMEEVDMEVGDTLFALAKYAAMRGTSLHELLDKAFDKNKGRVDARQRLANDDRNFCPKCTMFYEHCRCEPIKFRP